MEFEANVTKVKIKDGILKGAEAVVLRQSKKTGCLTIRLAEKKGCHHMGSELHYMPYEVEAV